MRNFEGTRWAIVWKETWAEIEGEIVRDVSEVYWHMGQRIGVYEQMK